MDLHDQPSTSRAARSSNKSQHKVIIAEKNRKNKQKAKPKAPALRRKKKKNWVNNELKNLVISLDNEQSKQDDDETINNHDTIRRSKRGHVPLQISNWVYSISDRLTSLKSGGHKKQSNRNVQLSSDSDDEPEPEPEQMPFLDKVVTEPKVPSPKTKRARRYQQLNSDSEEEPEPESELEQMPLQDKVVTEPKLPSPKKKRAQRYQQLNSDSEEEPEPESKSEQTPLQDKVVAEQTPLSDKVVAEPMSLPEQTESDLIEPSAVLTDGEKKLLQLTSYLRGASDEPFSNADNVTSSRNESAMHILSTAHLKFKLIEGIEYSFFDTEDKLTVGYMRFPPLFERTMNKNKLNTVRLIVVYGEFDVVVELDSNIQTSVLKLGEMVEIKMGVRYNIIYRLSECGVIMVQLIK